jgi:hypothetical protein
MRAQEFVNEKWSEKYKRSINCANPRGFSQRAHCQGRKKNEDIQIDERTADYVRTVMNAAADEMKSHGYRAVGQLDDEDLESVAQRAGTSLHDVQIILGMDHMHEQLDELMFKGSQCTKDCSGHMAGYEWSIRKAGRVPNSHSPSFNKGAAIQRSGL